MAIYWEGEDEETTESKERRYEKHGKALILYPTDPHGFWRIRWEKKGKESLPQVLDSAFTGVGEAEKAIDTYFNQLAAPKATNLIAP